MQVSAGEDGEAETMGAGETVGGGRGLRVPAPCLGGLAEVTVDLNGVGAEPGVVEVDPARVVAGVAGCVAE